MPLNLTGRTITEQDLRGVNNSQKNLAKYFVLEVFNLGDMYEYSKFNFINALGYLTCV